MALRDGENEKLGEKFGRVPEFLYLCTRFMPKGLGKVGYAIASPPGETR